MWLLKNIPKKNLGYTGKISLDRSYEEKDAMTVKRNLLLEYCAWLMGISLIPLWNILKGKEITYWIFIEILVIIFLIFTYNKKKKLKTLYDSTDDEINIAGSKEGAYDPDVIMKSTIVDVERENRALVILLSDGKRIRIRGLGKKTQEVFKDLSRICKKEE